ncbi:LOW QUALITY PROTEIN: hypothetical protein YC2023_014040 [Brassica napus]
MASKHKKVGSTVTMCIWEIRVDQNSCALSAPTTTGIIYIHRSRSVMNTEEQGSILYEERHRKFADVLLLRLIAIMAAASGLAKTILDASRSSNVRGLGSVDESAAAFEKRSKRLNLETDS